MFAQHALTDLKGIFTLGASIDEKGQQLRIGKSLRSKTE